MSSDLTQFEKTALIAPYTAGCCAQLIVFGVVLAVYWTFFFSPAGRALTVYTRMAFWVVLFLTAVHTAFCIHDIVWYSVQVSNDALTLYEGTGAPQCLEPMVTAVEGAVVQAVLALRALKVVKRPLVRYGVLVAFGAVLTLEVLAGALVAVLSFWYNKGVFAINFPINFGNAVVAWMWLAAGADVIVTSVYIFLIYQRLKDGNETTRTVFQLIGQGTLQSAAYTAFVAVLTAATASGVGGVDPLLYDIPYAFWLCLPSLYALSLISTLSIGDKVTAQMRARNDNEISVMVNNRASMLSDNFVLTDANGKSSPIQDREFSGERRETADSLFP